MTITFHPHALERIYERGVTQKEVKSTIEEGERFPAKYERTGFRRNFHFNSKWRGRYYNNPTCDLQKNSII